MLLECFINNIKDKMCISLTSTLVNLVKKSLNFDHHRLGRNFVSKQMRVSVQELLI